MWLDTDLFGLFDLTALESDGMDVWLQQTLDRCAQWFEASGASVFLMGTDGVIRLKAVSGGLARKPVQATIQLGQGIAGTVLLEGTPRIVGDPESDPVLAGRGVAPRSEIVSSMVIPLVGPSNERVGVINLSRSNGEAPFEPRALDQAAKVGAHVAMAVTNAQLVSLLRESLENQNLKTEQLNAVLESVASDVFVFDSHGLFEADDCLQSSFDPLGRQLAARMLEMGEEQEGRAFDSESDRTWLLHAIPMTSGGGVLTVQEVTNYQRAQDEASRLRRLAEIGQMTAALAHEIRNPLTGIRGAAQLIESDTSLAPEYSKLIQEEVNKLDGLCSDFLEISRPMRIHRGPAKLGEIAESVAALWKSEFEQSGIELTLDCAPDDPTIPLDVRRVEQIVHNLLRNALQACAGGGRVELQVKDGKLSVIDNGVGMDGDTQLRLFAPFFTTKPDGTGLGLCNVRRIVDAHGGAVEVWSEKGQGTRFEIVFPRNAA